MNPNGNSVRMRDRSLFGVSSLSVSLHDRLVCSSNKDLSKQFCINNIDLVLCVITPTHN